MDVQLITMMLLVTLLGGVFGSFVSMLSYRLPRGEEIIWGRSSCPQCRASISIKHLIPILSYIMIEGKCKQCNKPISIRYLLIELASVVSGLMIYFAYGPSLHGIILFILTIIIITICVCDIEHYMIPDSVQISLALLAIIYNFMQHQGMIPIFSYPIYTPIDMITGAMLGGGCGIVVRAIVMAWKKKDPLGMGDIKLMAVSGLFLGMQFLPIFAFLSGVIGIITGSIWRVTKKTDIFPFGPALGISLLICLLYPKVNTLFLYFINKLIVGSN